MKRRNLIPVLYLASNLNTDGFRGGVEGDVEGVVDAGLEVIGDAISDHLEERSGSNTSLDIDLSRLFI